MKGGFALPKSDSRLTVIGRTGSGKTHLASWVLSLADWDTRPWIIIDYKQDRLLAALPTQKMRLDDKIPRRPGLYLVQPPPQSEDRVEALLMRIWEKGNLGLYVDEGHMLPDRGGLQAIQSQGRSKNIQTIVLTQRPKWVSRFVFSEADAFSVFHLNDRRDRATVREVSPVDLDQPLERHHSYYYIVEDDALFALHPVPPRAAILGNFADRNPNHVRTRML